MKRLTAILCTVLFLMLCSPAAVAAKGSFAYVTDFSYSRLEAGGHNGTVVYTAYDDSGYKMGTLDESGELTREEHTLSGWNGLFAPKDWEAAVIDNGAALCPYADSHTDVTVCPYLNVLLVNMTHTQSGEVLEHYYIDTAAAGVLPDGAVHFCWGRYGYTSPATLRWDGESRYIALKNSEGLWGVYDSQTQAMVTEYLYTDTSAVYGCYAKVYNGAMWGRLDVSGIFPTVYLYGDEASFSVKEEVREIAEDQYQVFSADNEPISEVFRFAASEVSYAADSHLLLVTDAEDNTMLYDLTGTVVASFSSSTQVRHLQDTLYAVGGYDEDGNFVGLALATVSDTAQPDDTVKKGDVNFDGYIDSRDARFILRYMLHPDILTARQQAAADLDNDGSVTTADARMLMVMAVS